MEETTIERLARLLRQDAEDHSRMACGASWEYQAIVQTALLEASELLYQLKAKDDRIAVLEAFVKVYDKWAQSPDWADGTDRFHGMVEARILVGKVSP